MKNQLLILVLVSLVAACSNPPVADAKSPDPIAREKNAAPVDFEFNLPTGIKKGDEITTTIRFVARTELNELVMSASPYTGLSVISGGEKKIMTGLNNGDTGEIEVTVRVNDEVGYLAVFASTTDALNRTKHKNMAVRFGTPSTTIQKKTNTTDEQTEKLILMPAELN